MDGSAGVGAYRRPHAPSRSYHILQYIYILYTDFFEFICFFVRFLWDFILITSLQERGRAAPYPMTLLQYVQCYIHG